MSTYLEDTFGSGYIDALKAGGYTGNDADMAAMEAYAKNYSDLDNDPNTIWTAANNANINRAGLDASMERQKYRDMGYTGSWGYGSTLGDFMEATRNQDFGARPEINKGLSNLTGYRGNYGGGGFGTWLGTRDQATKDAVDAYLGNRGLDGKANADGQNLGADPWVSRAIVDATGYTGDFGRGELGAWLSQNPGYENAIKAIQQAAPAGSGLNVRYFGPQAGQGVSALMAQPGARFSGSRMAPGAGASQVPIGMAGASTNGLFGSSYGGFSPFQMGAFSPLMQALYGGYNNPGVTNNDTNNDFGSSVKTSRMAPQQSGYGGILSYGSSPSLGGARTPRSGLWQF